MDTCVCTPRSASSPCALCAWHAPPSASAVKPIASPSYADGGGSGGRGINQKQRGLATWLHMGPPSQQPFARSRAAAAVGSCLLPPAHGARCPTHGPAHNHVPTRSCRGRCRQLPEASRCACRQAKALASKLAPRSCPEHSYRSIGTRPKSPTPPPGPPVPLFCARPGRQGLVSPRRHRPPGACHGPQEPPSWRSSDRWQRRQAVPRPHASAPASLRCASGSVARLRAPAALRFSGPQTHPAHAAAARLRQHGGPN